MPNNVDQNGFTVFYGDRPFVPTMKSFIGAALLDLEHKIVQVQKKVAKVDKSSGAAAVVHASAPKQLLSISATESPSTQVDRTFSQVSVSFTRDPQDKLFAGVTIWFIGYKGNTQPVAMTSGADSPVVFLCETTKETVTVVAVPFGSGSVSAPFTGAKRTALSLNGVVSAPPAPSVTQQTVTLSAGASTSGQQFAFQFLPATLTDSILGYWIYRVASHVAPTPPTSRFKFVLNNPNQQGIYTFQDLSGVSTNFYYVSAVNRTGLESILTDCSAGAGGTVTTYRPTSGTNISGFTNLSNAWDGNAATASAGGSGLGGTATATWQGFSAIAGSPTLVKLKITASASIGAHGSWSISYSTNGGTSYTAVPGVVAAQTTYVITLSNAVDLTQLKIKGVAQGGDFFQSGHEITTSTTGNVFEIWVEATT